MVEENKNIKITVDDLQLENLLKHISYTLQGFRGIIRSSNQSRVHDRYLKRIGKAVHEIDMALADDSEVPQG